MAVSHYIKLNGYFDGYSSKKMYNKIDRQHYLQNLWSNSERASLHIAVKAVQQQNLSSFVFEQLGTGERFFLTYHSSKTAVLAVHMQDCVQQYI